MDSADKAILTGVLSAMLAFVVVVSVLVLGNKWGWEGHNEMITIAGSEMSEEGFEEFMENLKLDDGA